VKTRSGFVSNSSSSSFILLGFPTTKEKIEELGKRLFGVEEDYWEVMNKLESSKKTDRSEKYPLVSYCETSLPDEISTDDEDMVIGFVINESDSDGCGMTPKVLTIEEMVTMSADLQDMLGTKEIPKLIMSERSC
jgi:hypothetical protein